MSTGYRSILWQCPYFRWDKKFECHCEGGVVRMEGKAYLAYIRRYCAGDAWESCTLARALNEQYEDRD